MCVPLGPASESIMRVPAWARAGRTEPVAWNIDKVQETTFNVQDFIGDTFKVSTTKVAPRVVERSFFNSRAGDDKQQNGPQQGLR